MLPMRKSKMAKSTRSSNRRPWEHTRYNLDYGFTYYREGQMGKVIGPCHVSCFHHFHPPGFCRKALNCIFITHALLHLVIRVNVSNNVTVVGVRFPLSFSALVVAATPRMPPSFPGNCSSQPFIVQWLSSSIFPFCSFVRSVVVPLW